MNNSTLLHLLRSMMTERCILYQDPDGSARITGPWDVVRDMTETVAHLWGETLETLHVTTTPEGDEVWELQAPGRLARATIPSWHEALCLVRIHRRVNIDIPEEEA